MQKLSFLLLVLANICVCASMADPAPDAARDRTEMTPEQADAVLSKYINANEDRGGLCLIGFNPGATMDYRESVSVSDAKIEFVGQFGEPLLLGKALTVSGAPPIKYIPETVVVDAKKLKKIRILDKRVENTRKWCPNVKPKYLVVLYPIDSLPSDAELSINVNEHDELVELMAALTYLSPNARLKGKF